MNTPSPASLPRVLGPWLAGAILVGCVIGTGVFKKAHAVSQVLPESGPAIATWVVVGLLTLCGALALSEVASLFPLAGGNYVFLREAYGRAMGFMWAWAEFWFVRCASIAALAVVFAESFHDVVKLAYGDSQPILGFWTLQLIACSVIVALGLLAARGTKLGARFQMVVSTVKIGSLIALMCLPVIVLAFVLDTPVQPDFARFQPVWPTIDDKFSLPTFLGAFATGMVAVMWPYNGWTNVAPIAGEIRNPQRNIPIAFVGGVSVLILIYVLVNISYYLVIPASDMATLKNTPVASEVCRRLFGPMGLLIASAAIMLSIFGALGGNMLVGPRGVFALSRDGLAPSALGRVHSRYETPHVATVAMTVCSCAFVVAVSLYTQLPASSVEAGTPPGKAPFDVITDFIVFGAAAFETLAVGTIFLFRRTHPPDRVKLPFRCPGYPVVPALFIVCMLGVLGNMLITPAQRMEALAGVVFIAIGAGICAVLYAKRKPTQAHE